MLNGLSGVPTAVYYDAVTGAVYPLFTGDHLCGQEQCADDRQVFIGEVGELFDVLFRYDDHMHRRLWPDIIERYDCGILEDDRCRDLFFGDRTEQAR